MHVGIIKGIVGLGAGWHSPRLAAARQDMSLIIGANAKRCIDRWRFVIAKSGPEGRLAENILIDRKMLGGEFRVGAVFIRDISHVQNNIGWICRSLVQHRIPHIPLVDTVFA